MTPPKIASGPVTLLALAAFALTAAACGKQGALERPAPLWDAQKKAAWQAEQGRSDAAATDRSAGLALLDYLEKLPAVQRQSPKLLRRPWRCRSSTYTPARPPR